MNGMLPEYWTGESYSPSPASTAPLLGAGDGAAYIPSWLQALPHAAALASFRDGTICLESWNTPFERAFETLLKPDQKATAEWQSHFATEISTFAVADKAVGRFDIERDGPLGIEVFICNVAWVQNPIKNCSQIFINIDDRTADRRIEESLRRELVSDSLTALPNRIGFGEAVETIVADTNVREQAGQIGVMVIDLMRFSRINEALGTMAGDELILTVAARLKACVSGKVRLARLGGNEFGVCHIIDEAGDAQGNQAELAARIKATITAPIRLSDLELSIDCAVGCALMPVAEADVDELIRQAQSAARTAKKSDQLETYRAGELKVARQRFFLESHLRDTLARDGLSLAYQPIIDLATSRVTGFEALARWNDPELGGISPGDFIPVAEESGLIVPLGRWALHEAMRELTRWDEKLGERAPVKMNVNLSPIQMTRDDVATTISSALTSSNVDGDRLMVELTESAIVGDPDKSRQLLKALKRSNISIAMDDFGTGYSNMASLQTLPIDVLKIDRSFVSDMLVDQDKMAIIRAILSLSKALNMKATAEGIEDADVAEALRKMGCAYGQGYYFAKPMAAEEAFDYWMESRKSETS